jgi:hypothetical protein
MIARFENFLDVLLHVQNKFNETNKLSRVGSNCFYSHTINSIGCAIGCCFNYDEANTLQRNGTYIKYMAIDDICMSLINTRFNTDKISLEQLSYLQRLHDTSQNIDQFRERLNDLITQMQ